MNDELFDIHEEEDGLFGREHQRQEYAKWLSYLDSCVELDDEDYKDTKEYKEYMKSKLELKTP